MTKTWQITITFQVKTQDRIVAEDTKTTTNFKGRPLNEFLKWLSSYGTVSAKCLN